MLQDYLLPTTVESALVMLEKHGGQARLIAGGTDLVLQDNKAKVYVDITRIQDLRSIEKKGNFLVIGGGVTHAELAASDLVKKYAPALAVACSTVGGRQIRNIATIGGNIVTAQPAADGAVALAGLEAVCLVQSPDGVVQEKTMPELYAGVGASTVDSRFQMLTFIKIPLGKLPQGSSYQRIEQRKGLSLPMLCVAARVAMEKDTIAEASIVYAPTAPGPQHAKDAEAFLLGKKADESTFAAAAELTAKHASFRSSPVRGSKEFRMQVLPVCVVRALREACNMALGKKA